MIQTAEHGTYKLSPDEEHQAILKYQRQARQARILQVRAQEMLLAAKNAGEFRQRRKRESLKLLQVLKEAWQEEQETRKAALEADYYNWCKGIGQSHDAAQRVAQKSSALAERKAKEAEVNEVRRSVRFQRAVERENARKRESSQGKLLAKGRRKVLNAAAAEERSRARNRACQARSDASHEEKVVTEEEGPEKYLKIDVNRNDIKLSFIQSRLPGAPSDYKDTYFHSRFSVLKERTSRRIVDIDEVDNEAEVDAWKAAEAQMKNVEKEKERKARLEEIWKRRKAERGQAAAAKLQKISLLEKELAVELEEEQERKRQLQIIEDLTKAEHTPEHKADTWKRLQPTLFPASKELDRHGESKIEEGRVKISGGEDACCTLEAKVLDSPSKQAMENVTIVVQSSVGAEMLGQEISLNTKVEGKMDENKHEAETGAMQAISTREERTEQDSKSSVLPSKCKVSGVNFSGLSSKDRDKNGGCQVSASSANLPCCTPRIQSAVGVTRASKDARPKVSSLPNLARKSRVRKGNKSPRKFVVEATAGSEEQETADYIKEFKARSLAAEKDQARPSVKVDEFVEDKEVSRATANAGEGCTAEARKISPRKESNSWLSNILEKFPWWKCDSSSKEFSCPGVKIKHEKLEGFCKSDEQADRPYGSETVGRVHSPRTKHSEESSQEVLATRKNVPFRLETLGSLNKLRDTDWYCEEQPGWSEARTKMVFTKEELETLKLELYGTLTGETITPQQKKYLLGKEKMKQRPRVELRPQKLNPLLFPRQPKDPADKARSVDEENDQISGSQIKEKLEHPERAPSKPDKTKSVAMQEKRPLNEDKTYQEEAKSQEDKHYEANPARKCNFVHKSQEKGKRHDLQNGLSNKGDHNHDKKPSTVDCATQYNFAEIQCTPNENEMSEKEVDEVKTSPELPSVSRVYVDADHSPTQGSGSKVDDIPRSTSEYQQEVLAYSESNLEIKNEKAFNELASAREVAEDLIRSWRAGQLGGDIRATFTRSKQSCPQVSRKRRATTVEDVQLLVSSRYPGTTEKLGQLREKINRPQNNLVTKLRKWDTLTPDGGVSQGKRESVDGIASRSRDMSKSATTVRKIRSPPEASSQRCKEECSLVPGGKLEEETIVRRVEDLVPEARSLDFILGSLSAQVRELDERLQNVTAYSIRTPESSSMCIPDERQESKSVLDNGNAAAYVLLADTDNQIPVRSCSVRQHCAAGDSERVKPPGVLSPERERIDRAKKDLMVPPKRPLGNSKGGGSLPSLQKHQDANTASNAEMTGTRFTGPTPASVPQVQCPVSSMGVFLEDMAELMQELNGSPACQEMRAQLLQDSFLENLPRRRECGTVNVEEEDLDRRRSGEEFRKLDTSLVIKAQSEREERVRAAHSSFKKFSDICSGKVETASFTGLGTTVTEKQLSDGITIAPTHADNRSPSRLPGRISRSSLDLEDAMRLDGNEEHMLLSSVDFSPWNTANLPDVFTSISDVGKGLNYINPLGPTRASKDGGAKLEHCHLKEGSKYLLKDNEFKKKCRAFERKRLGRGKVKPRKGARKTLNPLTSPRKRIISPKSSTRSPQQTPHPVALKLSRRDLKLTKDSWSNITSTSLPEEIQTSNAAEEVHKWLRRDAASCLAGSTHEFDGKRMRSVGKYPQSTGTKKPGGFVTTGDNLSNQQGRISPPMVMTTPEVDIREPLDSRSLIKRDLEARRRPSSAGIVLSRR